MGYALVGLLALVGRGYVLRRHDARSVTLRLVGWAVVVPPLLYLPFNLQRRLIEGWQVPLAILASLGLVRFVLPAWRRAPLVRWLIRFPRYSARGLSRWALTLILLAMIPTNILLVGSGTLAILARTAPIFRKGGEVRALDWLATRATYDDVILSSYETGNYIPARVGARVYIGLGTETARIEDKRAAMKRFFDPATPDEWRAQFLRDARITYVFVGSEDNSFPTPVPLLAVYRRKVYGLSSHGWSVSRVFERLVVQSRPACICLPNVAGASRTIVCRGLSDDRPVENLADALISSLHAYRMRPQAQAYSA